MKKILWSIIPLVVALFFVHTPDADAKEYTLPLGEEQKGTLTKEEKENTHIITIKEAGRINLVLSSEIEKVSTNTNLYDTSGKKVWNLVNGVPTGNVSSPGIWNQSAFLQPGTYHFKIQSFLGYTGNYTIKVDFKAAKTNDIEPNNTTAQAQKLTVNKKATTGLISWNDSVDYYKFTLPKDGTATINITSYPKIMTLSLQDSKGVAAIKKAYISNKNTPNSAKWKETIHLQKGTYYIKIQRNSDPDDQGKYNIGINFKSAGTNELEPNNTNKSAQNLRFKTQKVTGLLSWNDTHDYYKIKVAKKRTVHVNLTSKLDAVYIVLYDASGFPIWKQSVFGSVSKPKKSRKTTTLKAGTYYVSVEKLNHFTGKYSISVE